MRQIDWEAVASDVGVDTPTAAMKRYSRLKLEFQGDSGSTNKRKVDKDETKRTPRKRRRAQADEGLSSAGGKSEVAASNMSENNMSENNMSENNMTEKIDEVPHQDERTGGNNPDFETPNQSREVQIKAEEE